MPAATEMVGRKCGRLAVLRRANQNRSGKACWVCLCDCGKEHTAIGNNLRSGATVSCGCYREEHCRVVGSKTKHRMSFSPEYQCWRAMIKRCTNPRNTCYQSYGGRGIKVLDRWRNSFDEFYTDMGPRPAGMSLDRIDVNGNYEPGNCRWADARTQRENQRPKAFVEPMQQKIDALTVLLLVAMSR